MNLFVLATLVLLQLYGSIFPELTFPEFFPIKVSSIHCPADSWREYTNLSVAESSFVTATKFLHPLTPKTGKDLISSYNTTPGSNIKVTRLKEMTSN